MARSELTASHASRLMLVVMVLISGSICLCQSVQVNGDFPKRSKLEVNESEELLI